ncbi:ATP-dependent DNA helicase DinG [Natronospira proteinivora]|uniref:ATP-dependent DNA helicase DinG n=1 Tax=Natronospira proteinivora TaxID=1807133 RepID=A0ABT1G5G1_9GAMM|nr:ATP-dependent DNA helicase [Natronospira proteinivora]MCP1726534.1 ATP-dependent DNA helicase DinG [Natronospira proteinivora]
MSEQPAQTITGLLGEQGPLARAIPDFRVREEQQILADAVAEVLRDSGHLLAEAGTGVGKTFAYLAPALASRKRTIISTGTRHLQDQLFHRDLPLVMEALGQEGEADQVALLKGRSNYLCLHRLETARERADLGRREHETLGDLAIWGRQSRSGDLAEGPEISERSRLWPMVTSTVDNCLGQDCPQYENCFVLKARQRAMQRRVVVVNHHLLLADFALREDGFGELLPDAEVVVVDEAHQLPETAARHFGTGVSARQLRDFAGDTLAEALKAGAGVGGFRDALDRFNTRIMAVRTALPSGEFRARWNPAEQSVAVEAMQDLDAALSTVNEQLETIGSHSKGLDNCRRRGLNLRERLALFMVSDEEAEEALVRWMEVSERGFILHATPLSSADRLGQWIGQVPASWVFTSATLAVRGELSHFRQRLGLTEAEELVVGSPFDYARNAVLYHPNDLPSTQSPDYTRALVEAVLPLVEAAPGGSFLLFTSHRALREAAELIEDKTDRTLLVQGEGPRARLLEAFREDGQAVLLGTQSFWEGVDVKGDALSLVVIDKLPFQSPGDPVIEARIEAIKEQGGSPFMEWQLPQAVITLKQGVGRLIRDTADRGVMVIGDPRLLQKGYGRIFIDSLPPMAKTRDDEKVQRFLQSLAPPPQSPSEGVKEA